MNFKIFLRKDTKGNTTIFGKMLESLDSENELVFEGKFDKLDFETGEFSLMLFGKKRKPAIETDSFSNSSLMKKLGDL